MKYLGGSFSLAMPGAKAKHWPKPAHAFPTIDTCKKCGLAPLSYTGISLCEEDPPSKIAPHADARDEGRPRKRICFG